MKRLIKDGDVILDGTGPRYVKEKEAFEKLEKYENIEEELGIDLITLFKALKNGIYHNQYCGISSEPWRFELDLQNKRFCYHIRDMNASWDLICNFKDYGKTWALTKGELIKNELE